MVQTSEAIQILRNKAAKKAIASTVRLTNHKCYALLGKTDIHPMGTHRNPYVLHYIYTEPSERGQGYATNRSKKLKEVYEITLFADELDSLFVNAGFHSFSDGFIFRYPK